MHCRGGHHRVRGARHPAYRAPVGRHGLPHIAYLFFPERRHLPGPVRRDGTHRDCSERITHRRYHRYRGRRGVYRAAEQFKTKRENDKVRLCFVFYVSCFTKLLYICGCIYISD